MLFNVRTSLTDCIAGLTPLTTDPRLDAAQQAIVGELIQADTLALNALRPDDTIGPGQRNARAQQIWDKANAAARVDDAHANEFTPAEFYNLCDQSFDTGTAIAAGLPTFEADY